MKKLLFYFVLIFLSKNLLSQITAIPDSNFEQALIDLGYDTGTPDGSVPTANIENITSLRLMDKNISDLTGIEDFIKLGDLLCLNNEIDSLDISKNIELWRLNCRDNNLDKLNVSHNYLLVSLDFSSNNINEIDLSENALLEDLSCAGNNLKDIDVSKNTSLCNFACGANQITSLDLSNNILLSTLNCWGNEIDSLDLSLNNELYLLYCNSNDLQFLNVKNGNNKNFWSMPPNIVPTFDARYNEDLECIEVDDSSYSNVYWADLIDPQTCFSTDCSQGCIISKIIESTEILVFPNPTEGYVSIELEGVKANITITLRNILGQIILKQEVGSTEKFELNINGPSGIYFLQLESNTGKFEIIKIHKK